MGSQIPQQATVISQSAPNPNQTSLQLALFKVDGTAVSIPNKAAAQADSVAANIAAMVVDFNALLAKLRAANVMS